MRVPAGMAALRRRGPITVPSGVERGSLPVMAGEDPPSTTCGVDLGKVVDGGPAPAMTVGAGQAARAFPAGRAAMTSHAGKAAMTPHAGKAAMTSHAGKAAMQVPMVLLLLLSGCALVDQDTFAPAPEPPPPPVAAPSAPAVPMDPRRPLLVIDYATPGPNFDEPLRFAIRSAESRDRRVQYDVIAVAPTLNQATAAQEQAVSVMRAIMSSRVPANRIHLGLRAEPWQVAIQVRVYVR